MDITTFLGRMHPLVVHLPIGFLLLAGVFFFLGKRERFAPLHKALPVTFLLSALSAAGAAFFGWLLAADGGYEDSTLFWHKWMGIAVAALSLVAFGWSVRKQQIPAWLVLAAVSLLGATGHLGGSLTHGADYLTQPLMGEQEVEVHTIPAQADSVDVYAHLVQPVLEQKCYACHNETKQNGGLNLADWESLLEGGDGGEIIGHDPWESELLRRVRLPQNSKKFMPPKGEPFTYAEIQVLKWWLENGAESEAKLTSMEMTEEMKEVLLHEYELDLSPKSFVESIEIEKLSGDIVATIEAAGWQVLALGESNHLLDIQPRNKQQINREKLEVLLQAKAHITWLDLGGVNLSDADLSIVSQLPNLSRLRLENSSITDAGLKHLLTLGHLESLNLYGNPITDVGLAELEQMSTLKRLYLWQTNTSPEGKQGLKRKNPDLELI